jgi:multidrug efflux pump subunit AcrA (membrane-fusion protein)
VLAGNSAKAAIGPVRTYLVLKSAGVLDRQKKVINVFVVEHGICVAAGSTRALVEVLGRLVFPLAVTLYTEYIDADGRHVHLTPGMAVIVDIKTGKRRILVYLFSPMVEVASQSMRER